jgi:CheY-like chemotaxis protein
VPKLLIVDSGNLIEEPITTINNIQEEFNTEIPVVLVTEDIENESMLIKSNKKITALQKPFSTAKLQQTIQKTLVTTISS